MTRIAAEADRIAGIAVIEPAPPRAAREHIDGEEPVVSAT
jgi:hypothetical protein